MFIFRAHWISLMSRIIFSIYFGSFEPYILQMVPAPFLCPVLLELSLSYLVNLMVLHRALRLYLHFFLFFFFSFLLNHKSYQSSRNNILNIFSETCLLLNPIFFPKFYSLYMWIPESIFGCLIFWLFLSLIDILCVPWHHYCMFL